jgi:excisionase family DNA binding protein
MHLAERITCSIADACEATGFSRTTINKLMIAGKLKTIKVGRRRLVEIQSLLKVLGLEQAKYPRRSPGTAYQQPFTRS